MTLTVAPMQPADVADVQGIEDRSFPTSWPKDSFATELEKNKVARYFTCRLDGVVVGFGGMWVILDEAHITTIAVDPEVRGARVGTRVLWEMMRYCFEMGVKWAVLEVRESNTAAIALYRGFGFKQISVRKKYYENDENALLMHLGHMQTSTFGEFLEKTARLWDIEYVAPPFPGPDDDDVPSPTKPNPLSFSRRPVT